MIALLIDTAATMSAVVLAAVLGAAGAVKITSIRATAEEFAALGLSGSRVLPVVVAATEVAAAVALMVQPPLGATMAALLLVAFTAVVIWALVTDQQVSCGCFGPLSNEPVSSATVLRNITLLALAAMAGSRTMLVTPDLASTVAITAAAMTAVVLAQAAITARQLGRLWSVELAGEMSRESIVQTGRSEE